MDYDKRSMARHEKKWGRGVLVMVIALTSTAGTVVVLSWCGFLAASAVHHQPSEYSDRTPSLTAFGVGLIVVPAWIITWPPQNGRIIFFYPSPFPASHYTHTPPPPFRGLMNVEVSRKAQPNTVGAIGVNAKWSNTLQSSTHSELILSPDVICHVWERGDECGRVRIGQKIGRSW